MKTLVSHRPYDRFSSSPVYGMGPGVEVHIFLPASAKQKGPIRALLDTGTETTMIYRRDVEIDLSEDVDAIPGTNKISVRLDIGEESYHVLCKYANHPYAGSEQMLLGMDVMAHWFVELDGPDQELTIHHVGLENAAP